MKARLSILLWLVLMAGNISFAQRPLHKDDSTMNTVNIKTVSELTLHAAQKILAEGVKLANGKQLNISIAITDRSGYLLAFFRMDNAALVTIDVAIQKAKTAALLNAPSKVFEDFVNNGQPSMTTTPGILPLQGRIPITYKDEIIGAVGVSGSDGDTDNTIATILSKLIK